MKITNNKKSGLKIGNTVIMTRKAKIHSKKREKDGSVTIVYQ